jgi:hypothetical protein
MRIGVPKCSFVCCDWYRFYDWEHIDSVIIIVVYIPRKSLVECHQFNLETVLILTAWEFVIGVLLIICATLVAAYKFSPLSRRRRKRKIIGDKDILLVHWRSLSGINTSDIRWFL